MAVALPKKASGSHFYRYSSPAHLDWLKTIILDHELYIPSLTELNDPADGRPKLVPLSEDQLITYLHNDFVQRNPHLTHEAKEREAAIIRYNVRLHGLDVLQRMLSQGLNKELEDYRIYSMSKRYDNMSLWAKYAADHTGYCLEFANQGPLFAYAKEVTYGDSVQMDVTDLQDRNGYWFFCKKQEWSNEEEVRIVVPRRKGKKVRIDPLWLTRLILGYRMSNTHRTLIREWAQQREPKLTVVSACYDEFDQRVKLTT